MWAVWLAAAAVAALVAVPLLQPGDDGIRVKGAGLSLQVFRDEGETSARLKDGDAIASGDRLGFRIRNRDGGYLMVLGIDGADAPYLCYPQSGGGSAAAIEESPRPRQLPEAIRMDDTPGTERIVAVLCEAPFDFDTMADALARDALPEGCTTDGLTLEKR